MVGFWPIAYHTKRPSLNSWITLLKRYVDGAAERERLEQEKKEAKLEKLRKVAEVNLIGKNLEILKFKK